MKQYDAIVIGGGPAGLTAALYLLRSGVSLAWCEKLAAGGQVLNTEVIENYPGFPKGIKGYELADLFSEHVEEWPIDKYNDAVTAIEHAPAHNIVTVGDEKIVGKSIIICSGSRYRKLGDPNEARLTGRGVSYCALCDGNFFRNQVIGVIGGGNSALEESLYLSRLASKVHIIHRRNEFRADKIYQDKIRANDKIALELNSVVSSINGDDDLKSVTLRDVTTNEERELALNGLFVFIGFEPNTGFLPEGIETDKQGFIVTDCEMLTNLSGVFAAGDVRAKKCRQVTTAVGDGATAANSAFHYLEKH